MADKLTVMNPLGYAPKVTRKELAPRLSTLDGKTVYLVDCRFDDSDVFLKQMQAWFAETMPAVKTVFTAGRCSANHACICLRKTPESSKRQSTR